MGKLDNVVTFSLAPGYENFNLFFLQANIDYAQSMDEPIIAEPTTLISDDEGEDGKPVCSPSL